MDIDAVCEAIAQAVTDAEITVNELRLTATGYAPDAVTPPHFFPAEFIGGYHKTFGGLVELTLTCRLMVSRAEVEWGQKTARLIASSTGPGSLLAAIEAMRGAPGQSALNGAADDLVLQRVSGPRLYQIGAAEFYGLEFVLFVMG